VRDQRKNFDDYVRERTSEFNQEMRAYEKKYNDYKKQKEKSAQGKSSNQIQSFDEEYNSYQQLPAEELTPPGQ
jgi:ATPase subunit of ABC transporter with duplicated ATPase domains